MAKRDSIVQADKFVLALSLNIGGFADDAFIRMHVSEEALCSVAIARARQFVALHAEAEHAFPGADVWLNGSQLVFSCGSSEGAEYAGKVFDFARLMPLSSGDYRFDEPAAQWYLVKAPA